MGNLAPLPFVVFPSIDPSLSWPFVEPITPISILPFLARQIGKAPERVEGRLGYLDPEDELNFLMDTREQLFWWAFIQVRDFRPTL